MFGAEEDMSDEIGMSLCEDVGESRVVRWRRAVKRFEAKVRQLSQSWVDVR